jgi:THO complex subunit 2
MAGIEPLPSLSETQVSAMAGGPVLRIEAVASVTRGARLEPGDALLKGPQRLGKCLLDSSLATPLLIQVAQQRQSCVFRAPDTHLKSLAGLYDAVSGIFTPYLKIYSNSSLSPDPWGITSISRSSDFAACYLATRLRQQGGALSWRTWRKIWHCSSNLYANHSTNASRNTLGMWQSLLPKTSAHPTIQTAALSMQQQERLANEEAEKRLKAALTAKREPPVASRVASPSIGNSTSVNEPPANPTSDVAAEATPTTENNAPEDITVDTDTNSAVVSPPSAEVS